MKRNGKFANKLYDGRWKLVDTWFPNNKHTYYVFENIYNKERIKIVDNTMTRIDKGLTTFSSVISHRIKTERK